MVSEAVRYARFLGATWGVVGRPIIRGVEARSTIAARLANREAAFLRTVRAVIGRPESPYGRLFAYAGIELGDAEALVRAEGIEGALGRFYDAGIYTTTGELKGADPIRRGSLVFEVSAQDFDNPAVVPHFSTRSGGSGGRPRTVLSRVDWAEQSAAHVRLVVEGLGWDDPVTGLWYPSPPGHGLPLALTHAMAGCRVERWFAQTPWLQRGLVASAAVTVGAVGVSQARRRPLPFPSYTPPQEAARVAQWIAGRRAAGERVYFLATPSSAVRICDAAAQKGLDLSGTVFRTGGESLTPARAAIVRAAGGRLISYYYVNEATGLVGASCVAAEVPDEVHLAEDLVALLTRPEEGADGSTVNRLLLSTLQPFPRKLIINWESGDGAQVVRRECGCPLGALGLTTHLHSVQSYEKLTSDGMTFPVASLVALVEEMLPSRFGGTPNDYQLVERRNAEVARVCLRVSPALGPLDEDEIAAAALRFLENRSGAERMMVSVWRTAGTLEVQRIPPHTTASKTPPFWREPLAG